MLKRFRILCIDSHASSQYAHFLLARSGYNVRCATFHCDALDLIHGSTYDVYVVNEELSRGSGKNLFEQVCKAAGTKPMVFYSTIVQVSSRLTDLCGRTPETAVPLTEVTIAVAQAIAAISKGPIASTPAALNRELR